jgi:methyl-accepting chemotaxis protein
MRRTLTVELLVAPPSASAQEMASGAQQLAATASELERLVGRFTVA